MGVTQINLGDITERKCTKYGLAHQIPPDFSVRLITKSLSLREIRLLAKHHKQAAEAARTTVEPLSETIQQLD